MSKCTKIARKMHIFLESISKFKKLLKTVYPSRICLGLLIKSSMDTGNIAIIH